MRKVAEAISLAGFLLLVSGGACAAQSWPPWADDIFGRRFESEPRWEEPERRPRPQQRRERGDDGGDIRDGGARPQIMAVAPPVVAFAHEFPANSIVIDSGERKLYYVLADKRAYAYPISVGREGFNWAGTETISRKQPWPDWHPPAEMRDRDPSLPEKMTGGVKNPLGAMALYLGNTLYRIHGTNDVKSIGRSESSGCFRMLNSAVLHLASITDIGTPVSVVSSLPQQPKVGRAQEPPSTPARAPEQLRPSTPPAISDGGTRPPEQAPDYRSLREYTLGTR